MRFALALFLAGWSAHAQSHEMTFGETRYRIFTAKAPEISLFWLAPSGKPFHQFRSLQTYLEGQSKRIRWMMNAGIFEPGGIPSGLLVIDHQIVRPLNEAAGKGNFYLQPNGVFLVLKDAAKILPTSEYAKLKDVPRLAIQSGPLLLSRGQIHPAFRKESTSFLHRNGVGVKADGSLLFAITEFGQPRQPNLYEFAAFFRSQGCTDALFLDGDISQAVENPTEPLPPGNHFGAIFAVVE